MKGNIGMKQVQGAAQNMPSGARGTGMIVGAVINKPVTSQPQQPLPVQPPQGIAPHPLVSSMSHGVPQMVPGLISTMNLTQVPGAPLHVDQHAAAMGANSHMLQQQQQQQQQVHQQQMQQQEQAANPAMNNQQNLANTKEKTPMCLINELARFNKIPHQYTLTDEQGPAHKKTFYVLLKLGDEEYSANGPSIKKAQHAAADVALGQTQYKHPPPKPPKAVNRGQGNIYDGYSDSITPTVELNALAMKRGEPTEYRSIEGPRSQFYNNQAPNNGNMDFRGMYNQRYPRIFYVSLKVGQREFIGEGPTRQAARHNAAQKALDVLSNQPLPNNDAMPKPPGKTVPGQDNGANEQNGDDALKSEISLVHEIALKRNLTVTFEVTRESGPPHMRNFVTRCACGEYMCEADGNSKKISKKRVAEKMLAKLQELPELPAVVKPKKPASTKKKSRNLIKANPDYAVGINPISRLIQIQQAKKAKEPIYTQVAERGLPRRREFVIQCQVGEHTCQGVGPNKKLAKRNAAESMLQLLGYSRPAPQPGKPAIKSELVPGQAGDKKVTFMDQDGNARRQLVPGVLLMPDRGQHNGGMYSAQTTAVIAKELLDTGSSPTAESMMQTGPHSAMQTAVRPKQQLAYLAEIVGFKVQFTDFPKGNKSEYLSLVSLSTNPPTVIHGAGPTIEASHDQAAHTALKTLAERGLDKLSDIKQETGAGDGPR